MNQVSLIVGPTRDRVLLDDKSDKKFLGPALFTFAGDRDVLSILGVAQDAPKKGGSLII